jgi:hypothetical protein
MGNDFGCDDESVPKKPKTGGFRNTSQRLRQGKENHLSSRASLDWRQDSLRICENARDETEDSPSIEFLKEVLMKSRTGEALLSGESAESLEIHYDMQVAHTQFYPKDGGGVFTMNPRKSSGDLLNALSRGLRQAWQHHRGALVNPMRFSPEEAVLVNRAQQADAFMISIKIAWELKLVGEDAAWNVMAGSPMGDVTRVFETRASKDFRTLNNGEAARAAYDKFFDSCRTKIHDKQIIHQMLLDDHGYMKSQRNPQKVSIDLFQKLGELPHGRNYLSLHGERVPTDMCYATVEDRSNANFLWFIKFERSFQEKELQMMKESVKASGEIVDFAKWSLRPNNDRSL